MPELPVLDHDAVLAAVSPAEAIERVREAFVRHHRGEWAMPAKVYLPSPPHGDFRAMPARGGGLALLKWVTSFPGNPARGLPTVTGVICLSDAETGEPLMLLDARSVTALRTGAVAAVAARALAREGAEIGRDRRLRAARRVGRALPGGGRLRRRRLPRPGLGGRRRARRRARLADRARAPRPWPATSSAASRPGHEPVVEAGDLRPGLHLNMLGADGPGKAEATLGAVASCALFCDEWEQASHGGELTGAVDAGLVTREQVTDLGAVLAGEAPGRPGPEAVTLFDSTGLAIQDLAVAAAALEAWRGWGRAANTGACSRARG